MLVFFALVGWVLMVCASCDWGQGFQTSLFDSAMEVMG